MGGCKEFWMSSVDVASSSSPKNHTNAIVISLILIIPVLLGLVCIICCVRGYCNAFKKKERTRGTSSSASIRRSPFINEPMEEEPAHFEGVSIGLNPIAEQRLFSENIPRDDILGDPYHSK